MSATISIIFFARKSKLNRKGEAPIYMRVTMAGKRFDTGTKRFILLKNWSADAGRAKGTSEAARSINAYLESLQAKAYNHQRQLLNQGRELTLEAFKNSWFGIVGEKPKMLMKVFEQHNDEMKALVGREFSPLTLERYITAQKHTLEFLQWKYKVDDVDVKKLTYEFITAYEFWLKSERGCQHNTTMKYLSNFKKIINICIKSGWLDRDPFFGFKMSKREVSRPFLVEDELLRIAHKDFASNRIRQVRDIFLFSCFTGLAYADVKKLKRKEITIGIDGEQWIWTSRQKTDEDSRIPLLQPALDILEKYKDHPQCVHKDQLLPVLSNQKMNTYLKEIADLCNINKNMTFHTARHTFSTTVTLSNGVPIETVSRMLGHRNLKTTQHYARILDKKVSEDMKRLRKWFRKGPEDASSSPDPAV